MLLINLFKNKIFKNFFSLSLNQGSQTLIQIVLVPLYLTYWDLNTYSEWILITTIPIIIAISNFGLTSYGTNLVSILYNKNKKIRANFVIQNIIFFTSLSLFLFYIVIILLNDFFYFNNKLNITSLNDNEFFIVISIIVFKLFLIQLFSFLSDLYRIKNKYHISVNFRTIFAISEALLIFLTLLFNGKILFVSLVGLLNYALGLLVLFFFIKKDFPWVNFINFKNLDLKFIYKIFYPSASYLIGSINKGFLIQGTIFVLNYFSLDLFTIFYNSLRLIINGCRHFINSLSTSFIPSFTINFAKNNKKSTLLSFKSLIKFNTLFSLLFIIILILFTKEPFLIWTNNKVEWNNLFFIYFIIANLVEWIGLPILAIPMATNRIHLFNFTFVNNLIIYFVFLIFLLPSLNIMAIPLSLFISNAYILMHSWILLKKRIIN